MAFFSRSRVRRAVPLFAGRLLLEEETVDGWLRAEQGRLVEWGEGKPPDRADATGWIVPSPVNAHTHGADTFLRDRPGKPASVAQLVGPGGWKAQNLANASKEDLEAGFRRYANEMAAVGASGFIDFREGGLEGVRFLRALADGLAVPPIVYGRPVQRDFQAEEARILLAEADGIGLSARRDFALAGDVEAWAEACRKAGKPLALHASEAKREDMEPILDLGPRFLVHCTQASKRDLVAMADAGVAAVVCPRSSQHYGMKPPLSAMVEAGVRVAVGTDNGMLHDGDLLAELALLDSWYPALGVEALLRMVTWEARALAGAPRALPPTKGKPLDVVVLPHQPWSPRDRGKPGFVVPRGTTS
jgi:cytosine/adenosine deaminase-related metal-dependent hydrolase